MRFRLFLLAAVLVVASILIVWRLHSTKTAVAPSSPADAPETVVLSGGTPEAGAASANAPTTVHAHNLMLRKGSTGFRIYVRWLHGQMTRTSRNENPSFDDPDSFILDVKSGVLHTNVGDLANFLNAGITKSPLKNIKLSGDGDQIKLNGTLHKVVPLPLEVVATLGIASGNRIQLHVTKINVLKIPFKGLLGGFNVTVASVLHSGDIDGVEVSGNDIFLDTEKIAPPPHIRGRLTSVRVKNPDFEEIYGNAQEDVERVEQWRNFLQLQGGTIDFGKLTMRHVDLIMVDLSNNAWFDLDLAHYQEQLVNGYTRMTPQAGMQIFMPSLDQIPKNKTQDISLEWLKHRNLPPPADVTSK
jgi:hypothetical protein